jgi:hypothetical protein
MAQKTKETLRQVAPNLWVSDFVTGSILRSDFNLTIKCISEELPFCRGDHRTIIPTGGTPHTWSPEDLDRITFHVRGALDLEKRVLIFCHKGRSRSACAAAAVLLEMGLAKDVPEAIKKVSRRTGRPAKSTVDSLRRWWKSKKAA